MCIAVGVALVVVIAGRCVEDVLICEQLLVKCKKKKKKKNLTWARAPIVIVKSHRSGRRHGHGCRMVVRQVKAAVVVVVVTYLAT